MFIDEGPLEWALLAKYLNDEKILVLTSSHLQCKWPEDMMTAAKGKRNP
jgi:hypothetical protein